MWTPSLAREAASALDEPPAEILRSPITPTLSPYLHTQLFTDWTLVVGSERYAVHRVVLCGASRWFYDHFTALAMRSSASSATARPGRARVADEDDDDDDTKRPAAASSASHGSSGSSEDSGLIRVVSVDASNRTTHVEIGVDGVASALSLLLRYCYDGSVQVVPAAALQLYVLSKAFGVGSLQPLLAKYLSKCSESGGSAWLLRSVTAMGDIVADIRSVALAQLATHLNDVASANEFKLLSGSDFSQVIRAVKAIDGVTRKSVRAAVTRYLLNTEHRMSAANITAFLDIPCLSLQHGTSMIAALAKHAVLLSTSARARALAALAKTLLLTEVHDSCVGVVELLVPVLENDGLQAESEDAVVTLVERIVLGIARDTDNVSTVASSFEWTPLWRCVRWSEVSGDAWLNVVERYSSAAVAFGEAQAHRDNGVHPTYVRFMVPRAKPRVVLAIEWSGAPPKRVDHPPPAVAAALPPAVLPSASTTPSSASSPSAASATAAATMPSTARAGTAAAAGGGAAPLAGSPLNAPSRILESYLDWYDHISFRQRWKVPFAPAADLRDLLLLCARVASHLRNSLDCAQPLKFRVRQVSGSVHSFLWLCTVNPHGARGASDAQRAAFVRGVLHATFRDATGAYVEDLTASTVDQAVADFEATLPSTDREHLPILRAARQA